MCGVEERLARVAPVRCHPLLHAAGLTPTLERFEKLYNNHLPQRTLGHKMPLQAIRTWQAERPELFTRRRNNQTGLDT